MFIPIWLTSNVKQTEEIIELEDFLEERGKAIVGILSEAPTSAVQNVIIPLIYTNVDKAALNHEVGTIRFLHAIVFVLKVEMSDIYSVIFENDSLILV